MTFMTMINDYTGDDNDDNNDDTNDGDSDSDRTDKDTVGEGLGGWFQLCSDCITLATFALPNIALYKIAFAPNLH